MTPRIAIGIVVLCMIVTGTAMAQQTSRALPPPAEPASVTQPPDQTRQIGDTTRYLLQLQASGHAAGTSLPMLGDEASASYRRYLKSFEHPIPEFYETPVDKMDNSGR